MLAAQGSAARRDVPPPGAAHEQQLVPAAQGSSVCRDVPPPGAAQEHNVIPARQEFAGLLPQRVIPLCEADLSRPPPLPVMPVCPAFPAPQKVFYGTFHNCTFNWDSRWCVMVQKKNGEQWRSRTALFSFVLDLRNRYRYIAGVDMSIRLWKMNYVENICLP